MKVTIMNKITVSPIDQNARDEALRRALEAARNNDPGLMLEALSESGLIDKLVRYIERNWPSIADHDDTDQVISLTLDAFSSAARDGKKIAKPDRWLVKVAYNKAYDLHKLKETEVSFEAYENASGELAASPLVTEQEHILQERRSDELRQQAIALARGLLPKIGMENVQAVMGYIIDAVERGQLVVDDSEIAEVLGLNKDSVRKWRERGFKRLQQRAVEAGYGDIDLEFGLPGEDSENEELF